MIREFPLQTVRATIVLITILSVACQRAPIAPASNILFAEQNISDWRERVFAGRSHYEIVTLDGQQVLKASSDNSASAILKETEIDLNRTPFINWRWRVENTYGDNIDEQSKDGDDYPARLYALVSDGYQPWEIIAVNYVWSSNQAPETQWVNAWTSKAQMLALRSGDAEIGKWKMEKRNLRDDFKLLFDRDVDIIVAVAIMTDSDNHHGSSISYFGDIYFSEN
jgi:hypothetical protein